MNFLDPRLPDRFWSKCIPEPNSGCWLWLGASVYGYGRIWSGGSRGVGRLASALWICSCGAQDLHDGGWVALFTSYAKHVDEIRIVDELITVKPEAEA